MEISNNKKMDSVVKTLDSISQRVTQIDNYINEVRPVILSVKKELSAFDASCGTWMSVNKQKQRNKSSITILGNVKLDAIVVNALHQVKQDGELYYIPHMDHFAINITGSVFHGGIGKIFTDNKSIEKIKDCKFSQSCAKQNNCNYYHDPVSFPGSKDIRNYTSNSWQYTNEKSKSNKGRTFGNITTIETDAQLMTADDINKFYDQTMHDILCSLVLKKIRDSN